MVGTRHGVDPVLKVAPSGRLPYFVRIIQTQCTCWPGLERLSLNPPDRLKLCNCLDGQHSGLREVGSFEIVTLKLFGTVDANMDGAFSRDELIDFWRENWRDN
jgi:hypothetical protein